MSHVSNREIESMGLEARRARLAELREEMMQLKAEKSLGGNPANLGAYKATRRSIARMITHMRKNEQ
ncbi:MAG: 50S ribosomal protein L29 [Candidatus Poseidoniaceae archaeon]|jgi:ribosomal protein L29|nr:50S ribosomal protein L29 [Candidatus Poseidoniaceae archaeon]MDP7001641.1 50S ribosomal protein L29 [Candidatus Poseidoniaceae archaeon]